MVLLEDPLFDKEVLYHLYLSLFTRGDLLVGAKVANVVLGTAIFTVFMLVLQLNRMRWAWLWWFLLISSGGYFLFRMNVTRPQVFSVLILLVGLHFLINERYHLVGLVSLLYSLSYTGHYQYVGLALGYVGVVYLMERRLPWKIFVWALVGMLFGWVVHPNFPDNISGFWLQNIQVIANQWAPTVNLNMGGEMNPMTTRSLLGVNGATLIPLWLAFTIALVKRPAVSTRTAFLFACSTLYLILMLFTKRFAEYWIPVTALFHASFYSGFLRGWEPVRGLYRFFSERRLLGGLLAVLLFPLCGLWALYATFSGPSRDKQFGALARTGGVLVIIAIVGGLAGMFVASHYDSFKQVNRCGEPTYAPSARFVRDHVPEGSHLLTCDWDDAPYVFFYSHKHYYTVFLDPNFMYAWRPKVWHRWDRLTHAKDPDPVHTLRSFFKAQYVYCTGDFGAFRSQLTRTPGATQIYPPDEARRRHQQCMRSRDCTICQKSKECPSGMICKHPGPPNREKTISRSDASRIPTSSSSASTGEPVLTFDPLQRLDQAPFAAEPLAGTGGRIGPEPEDFRVTEVPAYAPEGQGDHCFVRLRKRGLTSPEAASRLAQALGRRVGDVGVAGLKDRHAVTEQWMSVPGVTPEEVMRVEVPGVEVLEAASHPHKLRTGHLRGNAFSLRLVGVGPEGADLAAAVLDHLAAAGMHHLFGPQRFGRGGENAARGLALLRGQGALGGAASSACW